MKLLDKIESYINTYTIMAFFVIVKVLIHLVLPEYGFSRDELYYLTISDKFSFANLEILPVTPLYLKLMTSVFGMSIKSIHFASALCGAGVIVFTSMMTKELGGGKSAIALTALMVLLSGFLIFSSIMTYDTIDFLIWTAAIYTLIRIVKYKDKKMWLVFGLIIGLGLLNKLTIVLFGAAIFFSLLLTKQRQNFKSIYIWIGGLIVLVSVIPFVLWQIRTDWYYIDFAQNYSGGNAAILSFPEYLWGQFLPNNPLNVVVWISGLYALLFVRRFKQNRFLGFAFLMLFIGCYFIGTKFYFIIPFYSVLLAVGSIQVNDYFSRKLNPFKRKNYIKTGMVTAYLLVSFILVPIMMPVFTVENLVKYAKFFGVTAGVKYEDNEINDLPQHFADRFGWDEMTAVIYDSYKRISKETGKKPGIVLNNWGQASAVHVYGKQYQLPEPISLDGWFYYNTIDNHNFKTDYISFGIDSLSLSEMFRSITKLAHYTNRYCMPHENNKTVYYCSNPKVDLRSYWIVSKSPDKEFMKILNNENVNAALNYYWKQIAINKDTLLFTEAQINKIGYDFINKKDTDKALQIFEFNMELHPESFNVYDSYAEALMYSQDYEMSIEYYKKSLVLNPNNINASKMIKKIKKSIN